ncbi:MAG: hypothetical protein KAQ71_05040, partial [Desulfobulbaceae bacterium]|nr:hypothetical protein [Desulfobulbaceae bacterium]
TNVHPETVDFGSRQGRRIFSTAGVARLRRGSKKSENAVLDRKMLFLAGHKLTPPPYSLPEGGGFGYGLKRRLLFYGIRY